MASSFSFQISTIVHLVTRLKPKKVLDIGKGFGKYGFLLHEYAGINNKVRLDPSKTMAEQSQIQIDAVEVDPDLMLPHLPHIYQKIYFDDVLSIYKTLPHYDLIMMIDIIEHINKPGAIEMLKHFLSYDAKIVIATPKLFFEQKLYESKFEDHVSHWTYKDFKQISFVDWQIVSDGAIYLLSKEKTSIIGFGRGVIKKAKRIGRAIFNEFG